jgi:multidrug efflux system membrane fusion protein
MANELHLRPVRGGSMMTHRYVNIRTLFAGAIAILAIATIAAWLIYSSDAATPPAAASLPEVVVSRPLARAIDLQLGFLGQFSAIEQVELRAQVGGTLTGVYFRDGDIIHKGDLLFVIDARPYEIKLAQANALLETTSARLALADRELDRARVLATKSFGTEQSVDQRTAEQRGAQAAVDDAKAQIRDAEFDLEHCRISAPFTGRIGAHLVSVGNLIAGSRAAATPTTLLATMVSLDPIWLDFDMSESDYLAYSRERARSKDGGADRVEIALSDETQFQRQGTLDFMDNALNRSSGTIHARATVPNPDRLLTPGEFARVRLLVGAPVQALLVPDAAVIPDQTQHMVMTIGADNKVVPKAVEIGDLQGGLRVIRSGLAPNDRIIIDGIPHALPGARVAPKDGAIRYAAAASQG